MKILEKNNLIRSFSFIYGPAEKIKTMKMFSENFIESNVSRIYTFVQLGVYHLLHPTPIVGFILYRIFLHGKWKYQLENSAILVFQLEL